MSNGRHNITVYVEDLAGNLATETQHFSVEVPETFPFMLIVAVSVIAVAVVPVGIWLYLKKTRVN